MYVRQLSERALQNCFCIRMCGQITQTRFPPQMDARADDGDHDDDNEWKVMMVIVIMIVLMMLMMVKVLTINNHMGLFVMFVSRWQLISLRNVKGLGCGPSNA